MSDATALDLEQEVRRFLKSRFPGYREGIARDDSLDRIVDSLGVFDLVEWVESRFDAQIPHEEFSPRRFASIASTIESIERFRKR